MLKFLAERGQKCCHWGSHGPEKRKQWWRALPVQGVAEVALVIVVGRNEDYRFDDHGTLKNGGSNPASKVVS
jgi:hypothetical protein